MERSLLFTRMKFNMFCKSRPTVIVNYIDQWPIHGDVSPRFQADGDSHTKVPPLFDTQWATSSFAKTKV